MNQTRSEELTT